MSGGGVSEDQVLGTALTIGAAIAAPQLAPVIFGSGAGILGTAATGAVLGATANAVTNRDPLQGAVTGGIGGAASGYFSGADALAGDLSSSAAAGTGPGANLTQLGGQPFSQGMYDAGSLAADSAGYGGAANQFRISPASPTYDVIGANGQFTPMQAETGVPVQVGQSYTPGGKEYAPLAPGGRYQSADFLNANGTTSPYVAGNRLSPNMTRAGADFPTVTSGAPSSLSNAQASPNTTMSPDVGAKSTPNVSTDVKGTGIFGSGITGKQAMVGLGGLALWNAIQNENKKYGVPTAQNQVPANLNYSMQNHAPMQLTRSYAEGGSVAMPNMNNSPIRQQIAANSIGNNQMFPQPGIHSNQFANPTNTPVAANMLAPTTDTAVDPYSGQQMMAAGGIAQSRLGGYAAGGNPHLLKGPGDGMSDNIPAMIGSKQPARLADGEFVIPADVVSHLGNGSTDAGAKKLHSMMDNVRKARTGNKKQGKQIKADKYMPKFADGGQVDPVAAAAQAAQAANQSFVANQAPAIPAQTMAPQGLGATAPAQGMAPAPAQGMAPAPMAQQFSDYQNRYAQQYAPTNENFVRHEYMKSFGRAPDAEGAKYWLDALNKGATPQQVQEAVRTSPEYLATQNIREAMNQPTQSGLSTAQATNLIQSGYQGNLGRAADESGTAYYSKLLQSGQMTPQQFIDNLKASDEFKNKTTASGTLTDQERFSEMMRQYQAQQQAQNSSGGG